MSRSLPVFRLLLLLLPLLLLHTIPVYLLLLLFLAQVTHLAATLILLCPCHAVAYHAAPVVVAYHAQTSVNYQTFTDPPDHTKIL